MALKAKHEQVIFDQILKKWTYGKSIAPERKKLAMLNENMRFMGGPTDTRYARKLHRPISLLRHKHKEGDNNEDGEFKENMIGINSMIIEEKKRS